MSLRAILLTLVMAVAAVIIAGFAVQQYRQSQAEASADRSLSQATDRALPALVRLSRSRTSWTAPGYMSAARTLLSQENDRYRTPHLVLGAYSTRPAILRCTDWSGPGRPDWCSIAVPTPPSHDITMSIGSIGTADGTYRLRFVTTPAPTALKRKSYRVFLIAVEPFHGVGTFPP